MLIVVVVMKSQRPLGPLGLGMPFGRCVFADLAAVRPCNLGPSLVLSPDFSYPAKPGASNTFQLGLIRTKDISTITNAIPWATPYSALKRLTLTSSQIKP